MKHYKNDKITIAQQYIGLKMHCNGKVRIVDQDRTVIWEGTIKPHPLSRTYNVLVTYTQRGNPKCIVTSPNLEQLAGDRDIPHIYGNDAKHRGTALCLFLPKIKKENKINEWQPNSFVADTIIPWAALWLTYFEEWLYSNNWQGGGKHPSIGGAMAEDNNE
jgi:hypothetical protein